MHSAKQILHFSPKSAKLKKPVLFDFDIYVTAATEIQRHFRGYRSRKDYGEFLKLRWKVILI